jgi:hypothetical protein
MAATVPPTPKRANPAGGLYEALPGPDVAWWGGIAYDSEYSTAATIQDDWSDKLPAPTVKALEEAGIHGSPASSYADAFLWFRYGALGGRHGVFQQRDMPKREAIVTKALRRHPHSRCGRQ